MSDRRASREARTEEAAREGRSIGMLVLMLSLAVLALANRADAQSCTTVPPGSCGANTSASMTIPAVIQIVVSSGSGPQPATLAEFETGHGDFAGPVVTVSANTPWALSISAATPLWSATSTFPGVTARADKPASELRWSVGAASFTPLDVSAQQLATGPRTNAAVSALTWRVLYDLTLDTPGDYAMTVLFTVTSP